MCVRISNNSLDKTQATAILIKAPGSADYMGVHAILDAYHKDTTTSYSAAKKALIIESEPCSQEGMQSLTCCSMVMNTGSIAFLQGTL